MTTLDINPAVLAAVLAAINIVAIVVGYCFGWHAGRRSNT